MQRYTVNPGQDVHQDPPENPSPNLKPGDVFYYGYRPDAGVYDVVAIEGHAYVATNPAMPGWEIVIPRHLVTETTRRSSAI